MALGVGVRRWRGIHVDLCGVAEAHRRHVHGLGHARIWDAQSDGKGKLEFGYNKDWLNMANKAKLDDLLATWRCRCGTIEIVGHTDAVGKVDANLQLSVNRATAVRDYVIGAGVFATRIAPLAAGENNQQVTTYQGVRLRANRVVVVSIK